VIVRFVECLCVWELEWEVGEESRGEATLRWILGHGNIRQCGVLKSTLWEIRILHVTKADTMPGCANTVY
jgi:hypothetical protein